MPQRHRRSLTRLAPRQLSRRPVSRSTRCGVRCLLLCTKRDNSGTVTFQRGVVLRDTLCVLSDDHSVIPRERFVSGRERGVPFRQLGLRAVQLFLSFS